MTEPDDHTISELRRLALLCPDEYPRSFDLSQLPTVKALSAALIRAGMKNTAKAVGCGISWRHRIVNASDATIMRYIEEDASCPAWSWITPLSSRMPITPQP